MKVIVQIDLLATVTILQYWQPGSTAAILNTDSIIEIIVKTFIWIFKFALIYDTAESKHANIWPLDISHYTVLLRIENKQGLTLNCILLDP